MVEEFDMKMIFIRYTDNIQSLQNCFCYSWKLSKCSWILNPIQIRWIFNLISHQFIFFLNENIYVQVDWMLIFLFTSYIFFLSFDWFWWNCSIWLLIKQKVFHLWMSKMIIPNILPLFVFLNVKEWTKWLSQISSVK